MKIYERSSRSTAGRSASSSPGPGTTAAGARRRGAARAGSLSAPTRRSTSGKRSRRRSSPTSSRTRPAADVPEALTFETGANEWRRLRRVAAAQAHARTATSTSARTAGCPSRPAAATDDRGLRQLRLRPGPSRALPAAADRADLRPARLRLATWLVGDQRFVHHRPDVLSWETRAARPRTSTVTGSIMASLFASTTGTDSDWVVKLIDVYPEDYPAEPAHGRLPTDGRRTRSSAAASARASRSRSRSSPARSRSSRSTCIRPTTASSRATGSWSRSRAPGSRSSTAIRRPSSRTSSWPRPRTTGRRPSASTGPKDVPVAHRSSPSASAIRWDQVFANQEGPGPRSLPRIGGDAKTRSPFAKTWSLLFLAFGPALTVSR